MGNLLFVPALHMGKLKPPSYPWGDETVLRFIDLRPKDTAHPKWYIGAPPKKRIRIQCIHFHILTWSSSFMVTSLMRFNGLCFCFFFFLIYFDVRLNNMTYICVCTVGVIYFDWLVAACKEIVYCIFCWKKSNLACNVVCKHWVSFYDIAIYTPPSGLTARV